MLGFFGRVSRRYSSYVGLVKDTAQRTARAHGVSQNCQNDRDVKGDGEMKVRKQSAAVDAVDGRRLDRLPPMYDVPIVSTEVPSLATS